MRRARQTKIVATLGPETNTLKKIRELFEAGVDVFRLNFSHGNHDDHKKMVVIIRELETEMSRPVAIIADMQGPKLRIGTFKDGEVIMERGDRITFDSNPEPGDKTRVTGSW